MKGLCQKIEVVFLERDWWTSNCFWTKKLPPVQRENWPQRKSFLGCRMLDGSVGWYAGVLLWWSHRLTLGSWWRQYNRLANRTAGDTLCPHSFIFPSTHAFRNVYTSFLWLLWTSPLLSTEQFPWPYNLKTVLTGILFNKWSMMSE